MQDSHKHHYVPEWYQRRFMMEGQTVYHRLNLNPEIVKTPSGKTIKIGELLSKGPKRFFFEFDLYTTKYFGYQNDDIERYLFGKIDSLGSLALPAMVSENWMRELHPHVLNFYEYMDAQKLRTPKGLNWILNTQRSTDSNELLHQMQILRRMNCTMWMEAVMEIVSAEESDVKFIVSDSPVTCYNPACYPQSKYCIFPNDPGIELIGTRTIFPVDLNHCIIITNLEYARSPSKLKALKPRTNPRYFDDTIVRYDDIIRGRKLDQQSVLGINYILKKRAHKYIASAQKEWLYPEKYLKMKEWDKLDNSLLSKKFKHLGHGGEIFVGGKNGNLIATQDEFGRKPRSKEEWKRKEKQAQDMNNQFLKLLAKEQNKSNK